MSDPRTKKLESDARWAIGTIIVIFGGCAVVGLVKFLAWWRIAFGGC